MTFARAQIQSAFAGMELTDEVHWREVYDRNGTLLYLRKQTSLKAVVMSAKCQQRTSLRTEEPAHQFSR
jgi:hypothetical protein